MKSWSCENPAWLLPTGAVIPQAAQTVWFLWVPPEECVIFRGPRENIRKGGGWREAPSALLIEPHQNLQQWAPPPPDPYPQPLHAPWTLVCLLFPPSPGAFTQFHTSVPGHHSFPHFSDFNLIFRPNCPSSWSFLPSTALVWLSFSPVFQGPLSLWLVFFN